MTAKDVISVLFFKLTEGYFGFSPPGLIVFMFLGLEEGGKKLRKKKKNLSFINAFKENTCIFLQISDFTQINTSPPSLSSLTS